MDLETRAFGMETVATAKGHSLLQDIDDEWQDTPTVAHHRRVAGIVALVTCCAVAAVGAGTSHGGHIRASTSRSLVDGHSVEQLWYKKGDSTGLHAMKPQVLGHLWKVERLLVDTGLCPAESEELEQLRKQKWPRNNAGKAPLIGKVLYINLAWDKSRMTYMENHLKVLSEKAFKDQAQRLEWGRLDAVDKTALQHERKYAMWRAKGFSPAKSPDVRGDWSTAACAYSHYQAISVIPEAPNSDLVVIAEDDVEFNPHFLRDWEEVWPYVPDDWDVLRIGWFSDHQNCSQAVNARVDRAGWQDPRNGECAYCGAQAYIVNPTSKERVLKRFENSRITHADELLGAPTPQLEDPWVVPPLKAYVIWPMLAKIKFDEKGAPAFISDRVERQKAMVHQ